MCKNTGDSLVKTKEKSKGQLLQVMARIICTSLERSKAKKKRKKRKSLKSLHSS